MGKATSLAKGAATSGQDIATHLSLLGHVVKGLLLLGHVVKGLLLLFRSMCEWTRSSRMLSASLAQSHKLAQLIVLRHKTLEYAYSLATPAQPGWPESVLAHPSSGGYSPPPPRRC